MFESIFLTISLITLTAINLTLGTGSESILQKMGKSFSVAISGGRMTASV